MAHFDKPQHAIRTRSSDDFSAWRDLSEMLGAAENIIGMSFGIDPSKREFWAGEFYESGCRAVGRICLKADAGEIDLVAVRRDARREKIGTKIVKALEAAAADRGISQVFIINPYEDALGFFENNGYQPAVWNDDGSVKAMAKSLPGTAASPIPSPGAA